MVLPIVRYGDPVLRAETSRIEENSETLQRLIDDMIETMHGASGIGLAAPQIGKSIRLFVVDLHAVAEEMENEGEAVPEFMKEPIVFINPEIIEEGEEEMEFEEGCLSIPDIREIVIRPVQIRITFLDRNFKSRDLEVDGLLSRVIQHEFDHIEGILFTDLISPLKKRMLKRRLREIARGNVDADYPMVLH